ncbi:MAG: hypothetical protein PHE77_01975 [Candidatus Pacebacteria bacterium]|nr:hypothetical protein [Candidatus Paceibacterota bacterium]
MAVIQIQKVGEDAFEPVRASDGAIGYDVYAYQVLHKQTKDFLQDLPVEILPGKAVLIGIGIRFAIPFPWQCEVRPRSGLATKSDIELGN